MNITPRRLPVFFLAYSVLAFSVRAQDLKPVPAPAPGTAITVPLTGSSLLEVENADLRVQLANQQVQTVFAQAQQLAAQVCARIGLQPNCSFNLQAKTASGVPVGSTDPSKILQGNGHGGTAMETGTKKKKDKH